MTAYQPHRNEPPLDDDEPERSDLAEGALDADALDAGEVPVQEGPVIDLPSSEEAISADATPASAPPSPAHAALEALSKDELIDRHLRLVADLRRVRQRQTEELADARRDERDGVLSSLFDIVDNFERGLEASGGEQNPWAEGMRSIHKQMLDVVARYGVTPFAPHGEPFDAHEHEALSTMPDPSRPDGTVLYVERNGYRQDGRVLRPARVVVAKNH